jgi:hypothetical protein
MALSQCSSVTLWRVTALACCGSVAVKPVKWWLCHGAACHEHASAFGVHANDLVGGFIIKDGWFVRARHLCSQHVAQQPTALVGWLATHPPAGSPALILRIRQRCQFASIPRPVLPI